MWRIHSVKNGQPFPGYRTRFYGYGLGWNLCDINGNFCVFHTGDLSGMLSKTLLLPDLGLGVVVLTNSYYGGAALFRSVSLSIMDAYLGMEDQDWISRYAERSAASNTLAAERVRKVWATVETGDHHGVVLETYAGVYLDPWFGKVEVTLKDGQLWFCSRRSPKLSGPMFPYKANTFAIRWENREMDADAFAIFSLDEEGRAQSLRMKGISPDIDFSYDFQDLNFTRVEE
jgi:hypothetical protein